ncbi:MAG: YicC family protein [Bacteroidales bacterium]|nr:YicC family protein [Bacteroidales bacterium]MCF8387784.1 YicC family protein [Bacteroidales bacterium]MCF8398158.1 YicC family protein [Bacteroidales bacterium]
MIKSMTGYGKAVLELPAKKITIEIKTLNSKQIDISTRIPSIFKEKELDIRSLISSQLERGKIDFSIYLENTGEETIYAINKKLARSYYEDLKDLAQEINQHTFSSYLPVVLKMPEVLKPEIEELKEEEWKQIERTIVDALIQVDEYRTEEGKTLEKDFIKRTNNISAHLDEITPFEKSRIDNYRQRIHKNLSEFMEESQVDKNRFEQELIYYLEKLDVTEEKVRLKNHCEYFLETLNEPVSSGKKLSFISQEMGREINTLGSKANDADMQRIVVKMKDELEKIKEQLYNIL